MSSPGGAERQPTTLEDNVEVVRRFYEGMNAHDLSVASLFSEDVVHHNPLPGSPSGREGNERTMRAIFAAFPDWDIVVEDVLGEKDKVVVRTLQRGTHRGEFFGVLPTGQSVEFSSLAVYRLEGGLIVEEWIETDRLGLLAQLGVLAVPWESGGRSDAPLSRVHPSEAGAKPPG